MVHPNQLWRMWSNQVWLRPPPVRLSTTVFCGTPKLGELRTSHTSVGPACKLSNVPRQWFREPNVSVCQTCPWRYFIIGKQCDNNMGIWCVKYLCISLLLYMYLYIHNICVYLFLARMRLYKICNRHRQEFCAEDWEQKQRQQQELNAHDCQLQWSRSGFQLFLSFNLSISRCQTPRQAKALKIQSVD